MLCMFPLPLWGQALGGGSIVPDHAVSHRPCRQAFWQSGLVRCLFGCIVPLGHSAVAVGVCICVKLIVVPRWAVP